MTPITIAKLVLAVAGIVVFYYGWQSGQQEIRWIGIGLVFAAVLLRFIGRRRPPDTTERRGPVAPG